MPTKFMLSFPSCFGSTTLAYLDKSSRRRHTGIIIPMKPKPLEKSVDAKDPAQLTNVMLLGKISPKSEQKGKSIGPRFLQPDT